ncbi:MAG: YqeG family HAD IIIA-type phosphatase [Eubacteriales bacterium]|nr:YqeG family HAD IIIA-type phosphatase [Eubacteriales bacterium]
MFECFYPDEYLDSTYDIDFQELYRQGYRGVLFDIDNTLVPHGAPADARAKEFFAGLREIGMDYCLISNNKLPRVKPFADEVQAKFVEDAHKPSPKNYLRGMELMGCERADCLFVGDQLFTDIWGAKKAGLHTILVKPIHPKEEIQIVLKRRLEKIVLYFYLRRENPGIL